MGKRGVPDRWLNYKAVGEQIEGFPIRACKVPLKQTIVHGSLEREQWFTPEMLLDAVPNVGCVVDLTATKRYYEPNEFTRRGIRHVKIFCEGHVIPGAETVERFFVALNEFLGHSISKDKVLLVHCTHGLNRTGYLVARYMVEQRGFEPQDAIRAFNEARGHSIERANYLADLQARKANYVPIAPTPAFVFDPAEWAEQDEPARSEQASRDRDRRQETASASRSWSREQRTSSYGGYGNRRWDRHGARDRRQPSPSHGRSPRHRDDDDDDDDDKPAERAVPASRRPTVRQTSPEPEAPGSDAAPAAVAVPTVADASKPPKWRIPKKVSQTARK